MNVVAEESILNVGMLDLAVRLHVVTTSKLLPTHWTLMALGAMDVGVVPTIGHRFVAADTTVQRGKGAGQLHEQRRIVNVVIASGRR